MTNKLENLEIKKAQLQARIDKLRQREREEERKMITRQKIIAGAAILRLVTETGDDLITQRAWNACLQRMSEKDRKLFVSEEQT